MSSSLTDEGAGPPISSLRALFSQASINVSLAGLTEAERNRDIVFYDETLVAAIRFSIPASDKTLPFPSSSSSQTSFSLPIASHTEEEEESSESPPKLLSLLVSSLQVSLDASYTAPRLNNSSSHIYTNQPEASTSTSSSTSSSYLIPATNERDAAYRDIPLQQDSNPGEVTQVFSTFWSGNNVPKIANSTTTESFKGKREEGSVEKHRSGGDIWYVESKGVGMWVTEWRCKLPITFVRTRHPTPALLLTSSLVLRLQPSQLGRLSRSSLPSTTSASESLYLHDLLSPLSEGPSYPDESPAERAARANASLAKLPLGKLPSSVLGSKLVTPARNAKEVSNIITRKNSTSNGDMGDTKEGGLYGNRRGGQRALTNQGLMAFKLGMEGSVTTISDEQGKGLGEEVIVLQRSARRVLDVQSAILVRMRTITVPDFQVDKQSDVDSLLPTLILCVEVENPVNSGMKYSLDSIDVDINRIPLGSSTSSRSSDASLIDVSMHQIGDQVGPLIVEQGSQINLLYYATFDCPSSGHDGDEDLLKALSESQRNVSIKLLGRPILLQKDEIESYTLTEKFLSTWTCTLELAAQMKMVVLHRVMHNGAGSDRFRAQIAAPSQTHKTGQYRSMNSAGPLPPSPFSALPQTPSDLRTASTMLAPNQSPRVFSLRKSSARSVSAGSSANGTFVSLQRSTSDQQQEAITSPALPSALIGHSILARARQNQSATISSVTAATGRGEESRQIFNGKGSYDEETRYRSTSEMTATPMQRKQVPSLTLRSSNETARVERDLEKDALLPIIDRRSNSTVQRLLFNPINEEGVLIDVMTDSSALKQLENGQREASIQVQVENRSEKIRTLILTWQLPSVKSASSIYSAVAIQDDDVQVGPLQRRDTEVTTLRVRFTKLGLQPLPPLAIYDTLSGVERILQDLQMIVVE